MNQFEDPTIQAEARARAVAEELAARSGEIVPNHNPSVVRMELLQDGTPIELPVVAWVVLPDVLNGGRRYGEPVGVQRRLTPVGPVTAWCLFDRAQGVTVDGWRVAAGLSKAAAIEALRKAAR